MTQPSSHEGSRLLRAKHTGSLIGQQIDRYRVVSLLGAGGMGEVYLAEDASLGRKVALKLLPTHLTADKRRLRRFKQEARSASALNHPNILTIHEIGEANCHHFIATEFIEGETLRARLAWSKIEIGAAVDIAIQAASALAAAHAKGIVHRDIKPENIMVRDDGYVKVLDFGLAKLTEREAANSEATTWFDTEPGVVVGTVQYMSPEQVRGQEVDTRTDIWSMGVVLYEMMAGRAPYGGETRSDVIVSILEREPPPLSRHSVTVAPELVRIVHKCLEKDFEDRYQSAEELLGDLKGAKRGIELGGAAATAVTVTQPLRKVFTSWRVSAAVGLVVALVLAALAYYSFFRASPAATRPEISSIAVLPLENLSGNPEQEYFADGMTDALITDLAKLSGLKRVIPRTSVMRYKGAAKPPSEIARELNVEAVVTGSVVRAGDRVRITAQLINAKGEEHLWADSYERELRDVLSLQSEVVAAITREIKLQLTPQERSRLASARPVNPEAHEAYLKARFWGERTGRTPEELDRAMEYFQIALDKDPNHAPAHAGIAGIWLARGHLGYLPPRRVFPDGKAWALRAISLDETLSEAHASLGLVHTYYEWDWAAAEREYRRAIELDPRLPGVHMHYSFLLAAMKRPEEALAEQNRCLELDPLNNYCRDYYGWQLIRLRRYDDGIAYYDRMAAAKLAPAAVHFALWVAYDQKRMHDRAIEEAKKYYIAKGGHEEVVNALTRGYADGGYRDAMRQAADTLAEISTRTYILPIRVAQLYASAGANDRALEWIEKAYQDRDTLLVYLNVEPYWDNLRDDPRFQDMLRRMNLPSKSNGS